MDCPHLLRMHIRHSRRNFPYRRHARLREEHLRRIPPNANPLDHRSAARRARTPGLHLPEQNHRIHWRKIHRRHHPQRKPRHRIPRRVRGRQPRRATNRPPRHHAKRNPRHRKEDMDRPHRRDRVRQGMARIREPRQTEIPHEKPAPPEFRARAGARRKLPEMEGQTREPRDIREQRETRRQNPREHNQRPQLQKLLQQPALRPGTTRHRKHRPGHRQPEYAKERTKEKAPRKDKSDEVDILGGSLPPQQERSRKLTVQMSRFKIRST